MTDDEVWDRPADDEQVVEVGPWRMVLRGAELADVAHRGVVVLRAIRFVTRDHDWRTAEDTVLQRTVEIPDDGSSTHIRITASSGYDGEPVLRYTLDVTLSGGIVLVDAVGTTTRAFRRNRIGLVVLHPPTLAGRPITVRHALRAPTDQVLPTWTAPHQPATEVVGYAWTVDGIDADLSLSGDGFEMEDQRNWTDASFKTYSTPLSEPFPVALETGTRIHQSVVLDCGPAGAFPLPGGAPSPAPAIALLDGPAPTSVVTPPPTLQLLAGSAPAAQRPDDGALLPGVPILVESDLRDPDVAAVLASARRDAGGAPLDVRFVTDDPELLRAAIDDLLVTGPVARVGAYDPSSHVTTLPLQRALVEAASTGPLSIVAGTRAHFTELNRSIDLFRGWDGALAFSVTPQMHDRSRAQVTESLRMQRWVVMSASRLAAGRPLHVGPVTLRPRFNAVATTPRRAVTDATAVDGYGPQTVPDATDPAQHTEAAGRWFASSVDALTVPGVASVTLAEAWGPRGVVTSDGTRSPAAAVFLR